MQISSNISTNTQGTSANSSTTQGTLSHLLTLPTKMGTYQSAQKRLKPLSSRLEAQLISPMATVVSGHLQLAPEPLGIFPSSQETPSNMAYN